MGNLGPRTSEMSGSRSYVEKRILGTRRILKIRSWASELCGKTDPRNLKNFEKVSWAPELCGKTDPRNLKNLEKRFLGPWINEQITLIIGELHQVHPVGDLGGQQEIESHRAWELDEPHSEVMGHCRGVLFVFRSISHGN